MFLASNLSPLLNSLYGYDYTYVNGKYTSGYIYLYPGKRTLDDAILKRKEDEKKLTITEKTIIAYGISYAFYVLHSNNIMHGDLKPSNIILDENNNIIN